MLADLHSIRRYAKAVADLAPERGGVLVNMVIPFLKREEDHPSPKATEGVTAMQRDILFRW